jgi:hypothetical protein
VKDPSALHNLYGQPGQARITLELKAELSRLKAAVRDDDQFADVQPPSGGDGAASTARWRSCGGSDGGLGIEWA